MPVRPERLTFDGGVVSFDAFSTPHYLATTDEEWREPARINQDYGEWQPGVGLVVADGMGGYGDGDKASRFVVGQIIAKTQTADVRHMPLDEAMDILPQIVSETDIELGDYKEREQLDENAGTTLGAVVLAREYAIAVGAGDTPVYVATRKGVAIRLTQLTPEQCVGSGLTNVLAGNGRSRLRHPLYQDVFTPVPLEPGLRFMVPTDGLLGDLPEQRMPPRAMLESIVTAPTAQEAAETTAMLPYLLYRNKAEVLVPADEEGMPPEKVPYEPKIDDLTVGTLFIGRRR